MSSGLLGDSGSLEIRPFRLEELSRLGALAREIYAEAFGDSMSAEDLADHLAENLSDRAFATALVQDHILIADLAGALVGFVQFGPSSLPPGAPRPGDREIRRLYVLAAHRRAGIGSKLMEAALADRSMVGAPTIYLDVWEENRAARALYERFGFKIVGAHRPLYASGPSEDEDLIMMRPAQAVGGISAR